MALEAKIKLLLDSGNIDKKLVNIFRNIESQSEKINKSLRKCSPELQKSVTQARRLKNELQKNSSVIDGLGRKLKGLFAAYGGVMTIRAVVEASDVITGAENKLNFINNGDTQATQEQMDKMYAAALRSRSGYGDMLANVSKSMTLSPDAFKGNIDNAIKFQEIMAKSYAIGGASAAEQSSSMYQMIQALGSGVLQGDELRSVTEGAPLAAKAIEEYAQEIYGTTDALKDMGSQGLITSEIVVAAMMNASNDIETAFENTDMTIGQAFTNMKTVALNSFRPIQDTINEFVNSDTGAKLFNGIAIAIQFVMSILNGLISGIVWLATTITNNWNIIAPILTAIIIIATIILGYFIIMKIHAIALGIASWFAGNQAFTAWLKAMLPLLLIILVIGIVIAIVIACGGTISDIVGWVVGFIFAAITVIWNIIVTIVTSIIMVIVGLGMTIWNIILALINFIIACFNIIVTFFYNLIVADIANGVLGLVEVFKAALGNIGIFFSNLWNNATAMFWDFIHAILAGLADLEPAFNALASLFGFEGVTLSGLTSSAKDKADAARSNIKDYNSISEAWKKGSSTFERKSYSDAWNSGMSTFDYADTGGVLNSIANGANGLMGDVGGAWNKGNELGKGFADGVGKKINESLNIDKTVDPNDNQYDLDTDKYNPDKLNKGVENIDKNTGKMADSMELTDEDLTYLRDLAEREWKKEFTTANIVVDMNNYNTIDGDNDLDGIITKLNSKLYDELDYLANGTYGYAYGNG